MKHFYKGGRGLAFSQREGGASFRKEKPPRLSKILTHPVGGESFGLPSATVRPVVDVSSRNPRNLFDTCSGAVREVFECCSGSTRRTAEAHPKESRRCPEPVPKRTRSAPEGHPNSTRRNRWFFYRFLGALKARIKYRCSKDVVLFTQLLRKIAEVPLMYHECTVSVRGVYRKGTGDLLRSYWRSTTDLLNACTSGVDQRHSKSGRVVRLEAMKNKSMPFVLALICFMLFNLSEAWAQSAETRAAEGQIEIKPLQIGDTIPEELRHLPLQVVNHPDSKGTITLDDYRNKKLIILDFWATWCGSCLRSFPKVSALQRQFDDKVQFLMVNCVQSGDTEAKIKNTFESLELDSNLPFINHDSIFQHLFPHRLLPHYIWLNGEGKLLASSSSAELTKDNMEKILHGKQVSFHQKRDNLEFDKSKSLMEQLDKIGVDKLKSSSLLTAYIEGIGTGYGFDSVGRKQRMYYLNTPLNFLYQYAFADILEDVNVSRFIFDASVDNTFIHQYKSPANYSSKYCYELIFDSDSIDLLKTVMRSDLVHTFGVMVKRQTREEQVCQLTDVSEKLGQTSEKAVSVGYLVRMLNKISEVPIIVDNELARKRITFKLPDPADKLDLETIQRFLENSGLSHKLSVQPIPYVFFHKVKLQNSYNDVSL
ncbi:TlpA family protein disulfide reductase [Sphingobacterium haloxyli]|uniref:Thioredoxin domain-containing protein n=1 Tax=Sphingobacterium haloxyli TaxID=2100533 RepID=A0A2S9J0D6_9SPHI|nr:TlpA disulfide reductase family protein [Sphingobacterium haloxyli]PRD46208.1 hypothetical protein C5745_16520 [Sphingobacterium haloxyli]